MQRRQFIKSSSALSTLPFLPYDLTSFDSIIEEESLEVHIFSKHLQFLDYKEMGQMVKYMGFDGADLTVRPGGHVLPENAKKDLPKAVEGLRLAGLEPRMMTTAITDASDEVNQILLETAAKNGIRNYRMGWFRYPKTESIISALETMTQKTKDIAELNKRFGLQGSYQNHSGAYFVGASLWEVEKLLSETQLPEMGCQFDIRHAVVEGGLSWPNNLRLVQPRINTIVLKDCKWEKIDDEWKVVNTPIGEGMVDFDKYFKLLKKYQIVAPVSLHLEYDLGGAQFGKKEITMDRDKIYTLMKKDLDTVHKLWKNA